MAGQIIHYHQYHGSAKNVYDIIFSSLQMMGTLKYHCTGWPDEHSNIQWTTQCSLSSQVHCASMWMMAITRKLHLLHFSRNEGMPSIPEKWSGRYTHLGPMWFPNAADFQNWGYTLNSGNLASQAPPANKNVSFGGVKHKKVDQTIFFVKCIHIKNTFCKKNGQKRSIQPSAVTQTIYIRLYGVATTN